MRKSVCRLRLNEVLTTIAHFAIQLSYSMSYLQHSLQSRAGGLFVLVEGMGVDVQRGGGLAVAEDARHRCHIRAARDHQTGGGVAEGMDIQLLRQAVLLEDQLEAVGEGGGRHGELRSLTAEQEVIGGQLPLVIGFGDVCTFLPVLSQETFHLGREVHIRRPASAESNVFLAVKPVPSLSMMLFVPSVNVKSIEIVLPSVVPS